MKETSVFLVAGFAAVATRASFHFLDNDFAYTAEAPGDPSWIRVVVMIVFFTVLAAFGRDVFRTAVKDDKAAAINDSSFSPNKTPIETATEMARIFSGVTDEVSREKAIHKWFAAIPTVSVLIPFLFYLRFGLIGGLAWGLTIFFDVYCLLWAIGLYFLPRTAYHSRVELVGDWADRLGAFWLVACVFGPFFGWIISEVPVTPNSWHWVYGLRVFLAAGIPVITALPLLRYVQGKSALVALPLLIIVTLLPVSTAIPTLQDLLEGPVLRPPQSQSADWPEPYLRHTARSLGFFQ